VADGRAVQPDGFLRHADFGWLLGLGPVEPRNQKDDFGPVFETRRRQLVEAGKLEEEKLVGKCEILLEKSVTQERAQRVWQRALVLFETHGPQTVRVEPDGLHARPGGGIANHDLRALAGQQLIEAV